MTSREGRFTFFRQGAWMMTATLASGLLMFAVHIFAPWMPRSEYGLFGTLLQVMNLMMIPALGLQTVFARQTAAARSKKQHRQLAGSVRALMKATFFLWLATGLGVLLVHRPILATLKIDNPLALWVTVLIGWPQLWLPIFLGILQGRQNFLWLGWATILNGAGRFTATAVFVALLGGYAAGAMTAALTGLLLALGIVLWQTREVWGREAERFEWLPWVREVVPLTLGLGTSFFMMSADMLVARSVFDEDLSGLYAGAGLLGRGLVIFTSPLAAVMFPKIVRSVADSENTNVLAHALGATAFIGGLVTVAGTAVAWMTPSLLEWLNDHPLPLLNSLRSTLLGYEDALTTMSGLVPWFLWAMLPLPLANVLINNLLARQRFAVIPWLLIIAALYAVTLMFRSGSPVAILQTLACFNLLLLGVTTLASFRHRIL